MFGPLRSDHSFPNPNGGILPSSIPNPPKTIGFICRALIWCVFVTNSVFFKKVDHSRPFLFIFVFSIQLINKQMFNINFADDWSRTANV